MRRGHFYFCFIKLIYIPLLVFLLGLNLDGHPVWGERIELRQPDGTIVVGFIYGDEYHRRVEDAAGYTLIKNERTGWIEYALLEGNRLVPSGLIAGRVSESVLRKRGIRKHLSDRFWVIQQLRQLQPEIFHETIAPERAAPAGLAPTALSGTRKFFIIAVEFQSESSPPTGWSKGFYNPVDFASRVFAEEEGTVSLTNYFRANSNGRFWPVGSAYPRWVTLPYTASYYKSINSWTRIVEHALDQIKAMDPGFDFNAVANSGDLEIALIWAGTRETWGSFFWPHMSSMNLSKYGVRVRARIAVNERNSNGTENKDVGVFCHEYGHVTGAPDIYDYSSFHHRPLGMYCIMGYSDPRISFCGYLKWKVYGWVEAIEITSSGSFTISALALDLPAFPRLYRIPIDDFTFGTTSCFEYILIENRINGSHPIFENMPGRRNGLLITHVNERYPPAACLPSYPFYGVEAISPELDPTITSLWPLNQLWGKHAWAADFGHTRLDNFYPDARPAGAYLQLSYGDDTENIIFRNTQGHKKSRYIAIYDIGFAGLEMSFKTKVLARPLDFLAEKVENRSLLQREFVNILKWKINPANTGLTVSKYRIYLIEGTAENLLAEVGPDRFEFWHRQCIQGRLYNYLIVAVSPEGSESQPAFFSLK
ncbi:MAG: hypothetical protein N3B16_06250 [Candidatus Aminicenantes bacterium]|nr:hypothetical protein [Candidatus Aminicenantes bacterium]